MTQHKMLSIVFVTLFLLSKANSLICAFGGEYTVNNTSGGKSYMGQLSNVMCPPGAGVSCQRFELTATFEGGSQGPVVYGQCVPNGNCPYNVCSVSGPLIMRNVLMFITSITECETACCSKDYCNAQTVAKIKAGSAKNTYSILLLTIMLNITTFSLSLLTH